MKARSCVLTIAGSDSGAGAGIQADARTIQALGGYAATAVTAITAQNTQGVTTWRAVAPELITAQITAVLDDLPVGAIKTGLIPGAAAVRAIATTLRRQRRVPLVIDPVLGSTSGTRFLSAAGLQALKKELLPLAALVTPNWPEAAVLLGRAVDDFAGAEAAGQALAVEFGCAVLVKGGHAPGGKCRDCLVTADGRVRWFESERVPTRNTHGTGCVLSAAIACGLARGETVERAVTRAHAFLQKSLRAGRSVRWGRGAGPAFAG
ncbi:MAG: bifunctional hydroxymethylpyrimidine kinase/phosphomethylpyrimidine kinase [Opitutus sp.]|nr:bifunctional hydroxymethylpyrimidine kinase/phosphomethylpyrimidine kinase [Opitutus sp.]